MSLVVVGETQSITSASLDELTLPQLAEMANSEQASMAQVATVAFIHAVRTGQALNAAFVLVPRGGWSAWVKENCTFSANTATVCRRIGYFAEHLSAVGVTSVKQAEMYLKEEELKLPWTGGHPTSPMFREKKMAAQQMRREGMTYEAIAGELAVRPGNAWGMCNPDKLAERERRKARERSKLRRLRRDETMKVAGGATHEGYTLLRKAAGVLNAAVNREADPEAKVALSNALAKVYQAEDEMFRAVRLTTEKNAA